METMVAPEWMISLGEHIHGILDQTIQKPFHPVLNQKTQAVEWSRSRDGAIRW